MPALNALKAFEVAGRTGSFTRAAELLNVTQSAVSRQVRQLEAQIGETLLQRHHHHLELSAAGRVLLQALQQSFDRIELTVRSLQEKTHRNRLRINAPPTFTSRWLMPRLGRLRDAHPHLELSLSTRVDDKLAESGVLDCAIRFGNGRLENPHFASYRLPRFSDAPKIELVLLDRKDLPSAGAGEIGIVGVAPAIGNAIFAATGTRVRNMPMAPDEAVPGIEPSMLHA